MLDRHLPERPRGRVLIVGGGVTGLSLAHFLRRAAPGGEAPPVTVVETAPSFGGKIATDRAGGFILEVGPDSFISRKRAALELVEELGLSHRLRGTNPDHRKVYVLHRGRLTPLPEGMTLLVPTRLGPVLRSPLLSPRGKVRMALDLVRPARRGDGDESLASFVRRRFGREVLDTVAGPLLAGIHSADPERLSLHATFPRFAEMERRHGSLIRAVRRARAAHRRRTTTAGDAPPHATSHVHDPCRRLPSPTSARVTLAGGMDELVTALVDRLSPAPGSSKPTDPVPTSPVFTSPVRLLPGRRLEGLTRRARESEAGALLEVGPVWVAALSDGSVVDADSVVLATPAAAAARVLEAEEPELATRLAELHASPSVIVSLGFHRRDVPHPLDGFGLVVPAAEGRRITACTWTSTKFAGRAPEDHALLRVFLGGPRNTELVELDDEALVRTATEELGAILGGPEGFSAPPVLARVHRLRGGNPLYEVGHRQRLEAVEAACPPGLFLAGAAFHGVGIPDCIDSARRTARRVRDYLGHQDPESNAWAEAS